MELFEKTSPIEFELEEAAAGGVHQRALACARRYLVAEAELLEAIAEVDRLRIYEAFHYTHLTPYCVKELGLSEDVAACFVRVARKGREVPELQEAVSDGRLTVTKAKTIASVITASSQEAWIEKATTLSKRELEAEVAEANPRAGRPEKAKPVGQKKFRVEFELMEEEMELFRRAQEVSGAESLAETQVKLLKFFLDRKDPVRKADRSRDRSVAKHAVNRRDRGACQAKLPNGKICGNRRWVHQHHIIPKNEGGPDTPENLITLCSAHHRQWHRRL